MSNEAIKILKQFYLESTNVSEKEFKKSISRLIDRKTEFEHIPFDYTKCRKLKDLRRIFKSNPATKRLGRQFV